MEERIFKVYVPTSYEVSDDRVAAHVSRAWPHIVKTHRVVVIRAGDTLLGRKVEFPAGFCQECGRDLADDILALNPDLLCDRCFEQFEREALDAIPFDGTTPDAAIEAEPVSMWQDSRDAAF